VCRLRSTVLSSEYGVLSKESTRNSKLKTQNSELFLNSILKTLNYFPIQNSILRTITQLKTMKLLIVCSKNSGKIAPFIVEQAESMVQIGVEVDFFTVEKKGMMGYLKSRRSLMYKINECQPDIIHAHYGLSGLLANLQRKIPVVTTYHGSDINNPKVFLFSKLNMFFSSYNIFVSQKNLYKSGLTKNRSLIPCGVDIKLFSPIDRLEARKKLNLNSDKKYVLFAGSFSNHVKNPELAIDSVELLENVELLELKGYTREQVALLMNAVDVVLMTSFSEGSPQFIKEAMACNCPIVSVPVGDVREIMSDTDGCKICSYDIEDVADKLSMAFEFGKRTDGRQKIIELGLDSETVARRILEVYSKTINDK